jgi:hypothetical protein
MSVAVDVNVLLYASDRSSAFRARASELLRALSEGQQIFCLAWTTVMSYLRISTHHAIFERPLSPEEAMRNMETLLRLPHVRMLSEDEGFWDVYRVLAKEATLRGKLVPDAHLAAVLRQHGVSTLYTNDSDFRKFPFLRVINPFEHGA